MELNLAEMPKGGTEISYHLEVWYRNYKIYWQTVYKAGVLLFQCFPTPVSEEITAATPLPTLL